MKTIYSTFISVFLLAAILLTACSESRKTYKIGVSQCSAGQWRDKVNREMLAAQHLYDTDAKVVIANAHDDTQLQIRQIDSLSESGIDLLVVAPSEAVPLAEAIQRTRKKGIPVIFFDRKAETNDYKAFIGGNNVEAGQTMGDYAVLLARQITGHRPVVLEVTAAMNTSPARERHHGFAKAMEGHSELEYICKEGDWTSEKTCEIVAEQIANGPLPDIVFCHNDGMGTGAYKAVVEAGYEGKVKIIGIDGLPEEGIEYVKLGHLVGTYVYPTHGEEIILLALRILNQQPFERENTLQGMIVTPENADLIALNSRELIKQNDHMITIHDKLEAFSGLYNTQHKVLVGSFVCIALLLGALIIAWRAFLQTRKTIRQRQTMNEEQTLFYTDAVNRQLREILVSQPDDIPSPRKQDVLFAEQLNEAIRKNMSNPNLKMDDLGEDVGLGRVQLYRKVKALTGLTPVELLRQMRLQRAYALLNSTTKTVSEIAFEVGFNTPGYFSKCFKEQYGKLPMDLRTETTD